MASLVTARTRFLHVPKTGGYWVTSALKAAGVTVEPSEDLPFHANLAESQSYADRFTFAFVRHPLDWWRSYWSHRMRHGWQTDVAIDVEAGAFDFDEFIGRVVGVASGGAGSMFAEFVGAAEGEIDFIGRYEHLADDLVTALRLAGEDFDETALRASPRLNESDYLRLPALYRRDTAERLAESERTAIGRFYAAESIPESLLDEAYEPDVDASTLRLRIEDRDAELRAARTELALVRRMAVDGQRVIAEQHERLGEAETALARLNESRLLRYSRPLRLRWYDARDRVAGPTAG
jgi:hypothetical protein